MQIIGLDFDLKREHKLASKFVRATRMVVVSVFGAAHGLAGDVQWLGVQRVCGSTAT